MAASRVFAEQGSSVTLEHIADVAGVGIGTVYRRFRTVQGLLGEVFEGKMARYADVAEQAAEHAQTDAARAFGEFIGYMLRQQAENLAFTDAILLPGLGTDRLRADRTRALAATRLLVVRARDAGVIRPDFDESDFYLLQQANAGLLRVSQRSAPNAWKRFGQYMLDAFRHPGSPLEPPSPAWVRASDACEPPGMR